MFLPRRSHDTFFIVPGVLILCFAVYVSSSPPSSSVYQVARVAWSQLQSRGLGLVVSCYFFSPGWPSVQFCCFHKMKWKHIAILSTWLLAFLQGSALFSENEFSESLPQISLGLLWLLQVHSARRWSSCADSLRISHLPLEGDVCL